MAYNNSYLLKLRNFQANDCGIDVQCIEIRLAASEYLVLCNNKKFFHVSVCHIGLYYKYMCNNCKIQIVYNEKLIKYK